MGKKQFFYTTSFNSFGLRTANMMKNMHIPLSVPCLGGRALDYLRECVETNWVSSAGPFVERFERQVADAVGAAHAVATVNGTAALHVALLAAGLEPGDEVLVPALTFIAPANAVRYAGAWPVFIDVENAYWQMDPEKALEFLDRGCRWQDNRLVNRSTGRRVRGLLPVHILGHPADMDLFVATSRKYGLILVEDAAESLGAGYKDRKVGSLGPLTCFSFNGNKVITTGGGGMVATDDAGLAERMRYLTTQAKDDPVEYVHNAVGFNYRMINLQAALGCAQMEDLKAYLNAKRAIANRYAAALSGIRGVLLPKEASWARSTWWLYTILLNEEETGVSSRDAMRRLKEMGIESRPLWHPLHTLPPYREAFAYRVERADLLYRDALSLPSSVGLSAGDQERVIAALRSILAHA